MLRGIERALFVLFAVVAVWYGFVWLRAEYYDSLPVPTPAAAPLATLPGEGGGVDEPPAAEGDSSGTSGRREAVSAGSWLARLEGPYDLHATVLEGSDRGTLARAAGHIENTALPGGNGNVGIAGHRDTVFRPLRHIKEGDVLSLTTGTASYTYRVTRTSIVDPHDVYVLAPTDQAMLTLVTCYPFTYIGRAPRRFIVHARLIDGNEGFN